MTAAPSGALAERATTDDHGRRRHRRPPRRVLRRVVIATSVVAVGLALLGAGYLAVDRNAGGLLADNGRDTSPPSGAPGAPGNGPNGGTGGANSESPQADPLPTSIPGLGPHTLARIPRNATQVLVASGRGRTSSDALVTLWSRQGDGHWHPGATWPAHNAKDGWSTDHHAGDLHSPIGVFTLHDAGGFDPNPGSKLPYHHSSAFHAGGVGFDGEPLDAAFDYVIAIDYNRVPGTSPLDPTQPLGEAKGGGIWVHVDHGGPTHGCVSVAAPHMIELLRTLRPADHPVIVMGDGSSLAR